VAFRQAYISQIQHVIGQSQSQSQSFFTTSDLPPIISSWRQAPWDSRPVIFLTEHLRSSSLCNILFEDRMCLSFTIAAGPRQCNHSRVQVPQGLKTIFYTLRFETLPTWRVRSPYLYPEGTGWPSYTPRHWVTFSSPPTTHRAMVEVFEPASTRSGCYWSSLRPGYKSSASTTAENVSNSTSTVACWFVAVEKLIKLFPYERVFFAKHVTQ
jgi:hypothetical protein